MNQPRSNKSRDWCGREFRDDSRCRQSFPVSPADIELGGKLENNISQSSLCGVMADFAKANHLPIFLRSSLIPIPPVPIYRGKIDVGAYDNGPPRYC